MTLNSYHIRAWCDRTFFTSFLIDAETPAQALEIARVQVDDEPAEECNNRYPWHSFRISDGRGIEQLAWANEKALLRDAAGSLLDACRMVVDRWEHGDLAEAARACQSAIDLAMGNAVPSTDCRTITIEVRGDVVQDVSNVPPGWVYHIVDHDDAESADTRVEA
jgi:hypothetical protein